MEHRNQQREGLRETSGTRRTMISSAPDFHEAAQRHLLCQAAQEDWRTELSPGLGWLFFPRKVSAPEEHHQPDG